MVGPPYHFSRQTSWHWRPARRYAVDLGSQGSLFWRDMTTLTTAQLRQALSLREKIDALESELGQLFGGASVRRITQPETPVQRAPWARVKRQTTVAVKTKKRRMSAAGRARIAAAARKRWRLAKAAGKRTLGG